MQRPQRSRPRIIRASRRLVSGETATVPGRLGLEGDLRHSNETTSKPKDYAGQYDDRAIRVARDVYAEDSKSSAIPMRRFRARISKSSHEIGEHSALLVLEGSPLLVPEAEEWCFEIGRNGLDSSLDQRLHG